jgi:hypothetical protein
MDCTGTPVQCSLLKMLHVTFLLNHTLQLRACNGKLPCEFLQDRNLMSLLSCSSDGGNWSVAGLVDPSF